MSSSRIKGFYHLSLEDRVNIVTQDKGLTAEEKNILTVETIFSMSLTDAMFDNVIG